MQHYRPTTFKFRLNRLLAIEKEQFKAQLEADLMAFQLLQGGIDGFIKAREQLVPCYVSHFGLDAEIKA